MAGIGSFHDLLRAIRRQAWLMALILALGLPAAWWFAQSRPKVYEAIAVMQIEAAQVRMDAESGAAAAVEANAELDAIRQSLMARDAVSQMVESLGLFPDLPSSAERIAAARGAVTITKIIDPAQAWRPDAVASGLSIAVRLEDPALAAAYANALLDRIIADAAQRTRVRADRTLEFLMSEEARVGTAIADIEARVAEFRAANVASLPEGLTTQRDRLATLQDQRIALQQQIVGADTSPLRSTEAARQADQLREQLAVLESAIAEAEAAIEAAPGVERQLASLGRDLDAFEAELTVITTRRADAAMQATLQASEEAGRYSALERAEVPEFAVSADRRKIALAGAAAVAALAVLAALAREVMQPALRTAAQMKTQTGLEPVVVIPTIRAPGFWRRRLWRGATVAAAALLGLAVAAWPGLALPFA